MPVNCGLCYLIGVARYGIHRFPLTCDGLPYYRSARPPAGELLRKAVEVIVVRDSKRRHFPLSQSSNFRQNLCASATVVRRSFASFTSGVRENFISNLWLIYGLSLTYYSASCLRLV